MIELMKKAGICFFKSAGKEPELTASLQ